MHPSLLLNIFEETLWPTRCALCDAPGAVLCATCQSNLEYLDYWRACPQCGAAWGLIECDHCNDVVAGIDEPKPSRCISALRFSGGSATLIKTYKDKGEQRLAPILASMLSDALAPSWVSWAHKLTFIPATKSARRRRGFDHMALIAEELAHLLSLPCARLLLEPKATDQRILGRSARRQNMEGRFHAAPSEEDGEGPASGGNVLLIDDVFTTGATMRDAERALRACGYDVRMATIARV